MNTNERTAEEWGRVAVALPGWRWMPGMLDGADLVRAVEGVDEYGAELGICADEVEVWSAGSEGWARNKPLSVYAWPDPDDAATAGCLIALLEPASPCPFRRPGGLWVVTAGQTIQGAWAISPLTLGRACIAAAEALGRWPGGEG